METVECGTDNVLFVNVTKSYGMLLCRQNAGLPPIKGRENVYECTRKYWKLSKDKADMADYIVGVANGIVRGVYEFADKVKWREVRYCPELAEDDEVLENPKYMERYAFSGKEAASDIQKKYVGRKIDFTFGMNPVRYNF